mgnify:CR=1 FL=1
MGTGRSGAGLALLLVLLLTGIGQSQELNVGSNRENLATAMVRILQSRGALEGRPEYSGTFIDVDLDGHNEILAHASGCADCPDAIFALADKQYRNLLTGIEGRDLTLLDQKRNGYRDLKLDGRVLTWDGERYVKEETLPRHGLDSTDFIPLCTENVLFRLEEDGPRNANEDAAICGCIATRIGELGFNQTDLDAYNRYILRGAREGWDIETDFSQDLNDELQDIEQGCYIQHGWADGFPLGPQMYTTWSEDYSMEVRRPENPLSFGQFVTACADQQWVAISSGVGSPDRALGVCGCLAERLAMAQAEQAHLDLLKGVYDESLSENEADQISEGLTQFNDEQAAWCVARMEFLLDQMANPSDHEE